MAARKGLIGFWSDFVHSTSSYLFVYEQDLPTHKQGHAFVDPSRLIEGQLLSVCISAINSPNVCGKW